DNNPNLLWDPPTGSLHVIDHNLAFDQSAPEDFWSRHIFRDRKSLLADPQAQEADLARMQTIISMLPAIWSELPDVWTEACTLPFDRVDATLRRCLADDFWCPQ
ncbi:MAG TPA: HipA family kinase, partial [Tepidisphaeraceae bacterium]|nr:HipA family kinase [Tepidisphaeraceae bacterium]